MDILDGIVKFIENETLYPNWKPKTLAEVILYYLKTKGVVIKDPQSLPNEIRTKKGNLCYFKEII